VPDQSGNKRSAGISYNIPRITDGVSEKTWRDELGGNCPDDQMKNNFLPLRPDVRGTQSGSALYPEDDGQRGRDEQDIIKIVLHKPALPRMGQDPAIEGIPGAREQAKRIERIPEPIHNKAAMVKPNPSASRSFSVKLT